MAGLLFTNIEKNTSQSLNNRYIAYWEIYYLSPRINPLSYTATVIPNQDTVLIMSALSHVKNT